MSMLALKQISVDGKKEINMLWFLICINVVTGKLVQSPETNRTYFISDLCTSRKSYENSSEHCSEMGGYLLEVNEYNEFIFITSELSESDYWIGLENQGSSTNCMWKWAHSGTCLEYFHIRLTNVTNFSTGSYGLYTKSHTMSHYSSSYTRTRYNLSSSGDSSQPHHYICEFDVLNLTQCDIQPTDCMNWLHTGDLIRTIDDIHTVENSLTPSTVVMVTDSTVACTPTATSTMTINDEDVQQMVKELQINRKLTNKNTRALKCADDMRPSAQTIGWFGLCIIATVLLCIVLIDLTRIVRYASAKVCKRSRDVANL